MQHEFDTDILSDSASAMLTPYLSKTVSLYRCRAFCETYAEIANALGLRVRPVYTFWPPIGNPSLLGRNLGCGESTLAPL